MFCKSHSHQTVTNCCKEQLKKDTCAQRPVWKRQTAMEPPCACMFNFNLQCQWKEPKSHEMSIPMRETTLNMQKTKRHRRSSVTTKTMKRPSSVCSNTQNAEHNEITQTRVTLGGKMRKIAALNCREYCRHSDDSWFVFSYFPISQSVAPAMKLTHERQPVQSKSQWLPQKLTAPDLSYSTVSYYTLSYAAIQLSAILLSVAHLTFSLYSKLLYSAAEFARWIIVCIYLKFFSN